MPAHDVTVIHKKSHFERTVLESGSPHHEELYRKGHRTLRAWEEQHQIHQRTLETVFNELNRHGLSYEVYSRGLIPHMISTPLVISVGGDGTFLESSHYVQDSIMLGVNSTPGASVGYFTTIDSTGFAKLFEKCFQRQIAPKSLQRLQVFLNQKKVGPLILNDVLLTQKIPAATSRYEIGIQKSHDLKSNVLFEEQKSSGLWVTTPAGSTAAYQSAGGKALPMFSKKFAFIVREPYPLSAQRYRLINSILEPLETLHIEVSMDDAALYFDGPHESLEVKRGDMIEIKLATQDLKIIKKL